MALSLTHISVFGALELRFNGRLVNLNISGTTLSLFQYLICCHNRRCRREKLMEMFWPESKTERRRSSLNSALWRLKKSLVNCPSLTLEATSDCIRLEGIDSETVTADFIQLKNAVNQLETGQHLTEIEMIELVKGMTPCEGEPLDGIEGEWATIERERLENLRIRGLTLAMHRFETLHLYEMALDMARIIVQMDPFQEYTVQEMLCLHMLCGERVKALQKYKKFEVLLKEELHIEPMLETQALRDYVAGNAKLKAKLQLCNVGDIFSPDVCKLLKELEFSKQSLKAIS